MFVKFIGSFNLLEISTELQTKVKINSVISNLSQVDYYFFDNLNGSALAKIEKSS